MTININTTLDISIIDTMPTYTLSDYQVIQTDYSLPSTVITIVEFLEQKFVNSMQGTTLSSDTKHHSHNKHRHARKPSDDSWQQIREFKPTTIIDKTSKTNDIRVALNKLSAKNYEMTSEFIIQKIKEVMEESASRLCENIITNTLSEIKVNEIIKSISEKISMKLKNNNWYRRLIKGWESKVKTERKVKLRYQGPSRMRNKRRHKKNEEKDKKKYEDERKKRKWYIIRSRKFSDVKLIKDTSKEQVLLYLAKTYYVEVVVEVVVVLLFIDFLFIVI
jgi:hypothetical protein